MAIQNQNDINGLDLEIGQVTIRNTILKIVFWLKLSKKSIKFQVDNNNKNTSSLHEACFINTSIGYLGILGVCTRGKYIYIANSDSLLNERLIWYQTMLHCLVNIKYSIKNVLLIKYKCI